MLQQGFQFRTFASVNDDQPTRSHLVYQDSLDIRESVSPLFSESKRR